MSMLALPVIGDMDSGTWEIGPLSVMLPAFVITMQEKKIKIPIPALSEAEEPSQFEFVAKEGNF